MLSLFGSTRLAAPDGTSEKESAALRPVGLHEREHIPELDGLRGIAALAVVVSHSANAGFLPGALGKGFGQQGVALFYILSGYLIFSLYLDREFTRRNVIGYVIARYARVLPLFYAAVVVATALLLLTGIPVYAFDDLRGFLRNALLVQGTSVLWSIPVEIHFYILFIGLWWATQEGIPKWAAMLSLLSLQGVILILTEPGILPLEKDYSIGYWLHFFAFGGALSMVRFAAPAPRWLGVAAIMAFPIALPSVRRLMDWPVLENYVDPITAGYPLLIFVIALSGCRSFAFLSIPFFRYLGHISFGVYLIHQPLIILIPSMQIGGFAAFATVLVLSIALASFSLFAYERPIQKRLRR
jgi:peptidoglycan/LPS O-acetylase OafA/YrhL